ncbi:class I SAM-dependent methyltransferase [Synechococcus lacustris Tous-12m]
MSIVDMFCSCCGSFLYFRAIINDLPPAAQYFTKKPNQLSSIDAYIYSCNTCSHVTLDVKPVTYYKCVIRSAGVSDEMRKFRLRQFSLIKDLYFQNLDIVRCLEIGAGSGTYAHIMAEIFGNVVATEYNSKEASNSHSNLTFVSTHPEDESFLEILSAFAPFDIICCFSYLEHLPDPSIFFTKSLPLLANGGILLVEVPNTDLILKKIW